MFTTEFYCGSVDGKQIKMTEDHRLTSSSERLRIKETGEPLKDGETRLCGRGKLGSVNLLLKSIGGYREPLYFFPLVQV